MVFYLEEGVINQRVIISTPGIPSPTPNRFSVFRGVLNVTSLTYHFNIHFLFKYFLEDNMLHNNKLGYISASHTIIWTGVFLLIWAIGSYLIYTLTIPNPILCFPPFSGCVPISRAGDFYISGYFYRLLILPLSPLLGISMYFILQFLEHINPKIHLNTKRILFILGCVITPISLAPCRSIYKWFPSTW